MPSAQRRAKKTSEFFCIHHEKLDWSIVPVFQQLPQFICHFFVFRHSQIPCITKTIYQFDEQLYNCYRAFAEELVELVILQLNYNFNWPWRKTNQAVNYHLTKVVAFQTHGLLISRAADQCNIKQYNRKTKNYNKISNSLSERTQQLQVVGIQLVLAEI